MNLKEYAEQEGITLAEAKERTGLTHWKQEVPAGEPVADVVIEVPVLEESAEQEPVIEEAVAEIAEPETETVNVAPEPEEKPEKGLSLPKGITPEQVWLSTRAVGKKSKLWKYRELAKAPANYKGR